MGWMTRPVARLYFAVQAAAGALWWAAVAVSPVIREATLGRLNPVAVAVLDIPLFVVASGIAAAGSRRAGVVAAAWTTLVAVLLGCYATATGQAGWGVVLMVGAAAASLPAAFLLGTGGLPTQVLFRGPFRARPARAGGTPARHLATTAAQIVVFWGLALAVVPAIIAALEERWMLSLAAPPAVRVAGVALFLAASALGLWSAVAMSSVGEGTPLPVATARRLVIRGPYRFARNPMAIAGIVQGVAVGLMLSSWLVVVYAAAGLVIWNHLIRPVEEADLEARFGEEFRRYRAEVRCWWPRLRPVAPSVSGPLV